MCVVKMEQKFWLSIQRVQVARKCQISIVSSDQLLKRTSLIFFAIILSCDLKTFHARRLLTLYYFIYKCVCQHLCSLKLNRQETECLVYPWCVSITNRKVCNLICIFFCLLYSGSMSKLLLLLEGSINLSHANISFILLREKQQKLILVILSKHCVLAKENSTRQKHKQGE